MEEDGDKAIEDKEGEAEDERDGDDKEDGPGRLGDCKELDDDILAWISTGGLMTRLVSHPCVDWLKWILDV